MSMPLSILDLVPVPSGLTASQALCHSIELARRADALGYTRYWFAEHHNFPGIASSAPEIMIGQVARETVRLRVGSGGVMLPNHAPLKVAEQFRLLEALFPGRIDLGLGRAPGADHLTAYALRRSREAIGRDDFPEQLAELTAFAGVGFPADHPFRPVEAMPVGVDLPPIWILGSSDYGARVAAVNGLRFSFAHHINPTTAIPAMRLYRSGFVPSAALERPYAMIAVSAICAETDEDAARLATSMQLSWVRLRTGKPGPLPSPEEALAYPYTPMEQEIVRETRGRQFVGSPSTVRALLDDLIAQTDADEIMIVSAIHAHGARLRSYELLADAFETARITLAG